MDTIKLLEENIRVSLYDFELSDRFLAVIPKAQVKQNKTKKNHTKNKTKQTDQLDIITMKCFYASENIIKTVKRQFLDWEKIVANHILNK